MINLDETIRAIVYCQFSEYSDLMVGISEKGGEVTAKGRIRWYRENTGDAFKDRDDKHWFESRKEGKTIQEFIDLTKETIEQMRFAASAAGFAVDEPVFILERGDKTFDEFIDEFRKQPFVHSKVLGSVH